MTKTSRYSLALAIVAAAVLPATLAEAQNYGGYAQQAPLYPYAVQGDQPYAVEVAPNTFMIQRPAGTRGYPYVHGRNEAKPALEQDRPRRQADRGLIEELRNRSKSKRTVVNTTQIVRDPPVVIETKRVVDDPPRVIERRRIVGDAPVRSRRTQAAVAGDDSSKRSSGEDNKKRVIQADAEVTIIGPDRMSIRLFRKGHNAKASADAQ
jgi:hypothetical protein